LQLAVVYEDAGDHADYFNHSEGKKDGYYAYHYAQKLHQSGGSAIYFAVDYDASLAETQGRIQDYFHGVQQGFKDYSNGQSLYDVGVYGSGAVCRYMKTHLPFVKYAWLAESTGWMGSKEYADWNLKQFVTKQKLCGLAAGGWERNEANGDFGQFILELT
jgi:glycoside hydrolase-like protein